MTTNKKLIWRSIAVGCLLLWTIVLLWNIAFFKPQKSLVLITDAVYLTLCMLSMLVSIILIFYPLNLYIYAFMCCMWGILTIIDKGETNGYLMFLLGIAFAYNQGFFVYHRKIKIVVIIGLLLLVNLTLLRFDIDFFANSLLDGFFVVIFFTFIFFLFREKIEFYLLYENKEIRINETTITEEELDILKCVLTGQQYKNIGLERNKSESSIKQIMITIFQKIGVQNKKELLQLYNDKKIIF